MYLYPEDVREIAGKCKGAPTTTHLFRLGERLEMIADAAVSQYGKEKASVSIDASGARGYALAAERELLGEHS